MKIAATIKWGNAVIEVAVPDPSKLVRPERYGQVQTAVRALAAKINAALDDDGPNGIDPTDDKALALLRPHRPKAEAKPTVVKRSG